MTSDSTKTTNDRTTTDTGWVLAKSGKEAIQLGWAGEAYTSLEIARFNLAEIEDEDERDATDIYCVSICAERLRP